MLRFFRVPILLKRRGRFLSATQAPVTGLTDILTPVNLLPNSDFSRDGGYATTQTWESIASNSTKQLRYNWSLYFPYALTNVTATYNGDGSITITGTLNSEGTISPVAVRVNTLSPKPNVWYTSRFSVKDLSSNVVYCYTAYNGTTTESYATENNTGYSVRVVKWSTNSGTMFQPMIAVDTSISKTFSVTFYDMSLYEGEFKNPPVTTSLDVKPSNQFILTDCSNFSAKNYYKTLTTARIHVTSGWVRLLQFNIMESGYQNAYYELIMGKTFNYGKCFYNSLKIWTLINNNQQNQVAIDAEECFSEGQSTYNYNFTKYRITKSSADSKIYYLEGYIATEVNDIYTMVIKLAFVGNYLNAIALDKAWQGYLPVIPNSYTISANDTVVSPGEFIPRRFGANFAS